MNCLFSGTLYNLNQIKEHTWEAPSEDWSKWNERYQSRPAVTNPAAAIERLRFVRGTLVIHPLEFLKNEKKIKSFADLLANPSLAVTKEGIAQWINGSLFE